LPAGGSRLMGGLGSAGAAATFRYKCRSKQVRYLMDNRTLLAAMLQAAMLQIR
jgi:hypothetical protein